jgi:hypothetical protein
MQNEIESHFLSAESRGVTGPDGAGCFGVSFNTEQSVVRLKIPARDLEYFAKAILDRIHQTRSSFEATHSIPFDIPGQTNIQQP